MSTKLVIVESPNKVRSIAGYLGPEFDVEASVGHIRDLPQPSELPATMKKGPYGKFAVDVEDDFTPYYVVNPDKKKTVAQLTSRGFPEVRSLAELAAECRGLHLPYDENVAAQRLAAVRSALAELI